MTVATDQRNNYLHDGVSEAVTHTAAATTTATTVYAYRDELSYREAVLSGAGATEPTTKVWVMWAGSVVPVQGDTITDSSSVVDTITAVSVAPGERIGSTVIKYRCICTQRI